MKKIWICNLKIIFFCKNILKYLKIVHIETKLKVEKHKLVFVFDSSNIFQFIALLKWCKNWKMTKFWGFNRRALFLHFMPSMALKYTVPLDMKSETNDKKKINFSTYLFDQTFRLLFNISGYIYDVILLNEGKKIWIWKACVFPRTKVRSPLNTLNWGRADRRTNPSLPPEIRKFFEILT